VSRVDGKGRTVSMRLKPQTAEDTARFHGLSAWLMAA
jgi:hypothetical protein